MIKNIYQQYISIGKKAGLNKTELKRVELFNVFCLVWYFFMLLIPIEDYFLTKGITKETYITLIAMFLTITVARQLFAKGKYEAAYTAYIGQVIVLTFYFSNHLNKGLYLEYYYIFAPTICLIFIDNKKIIYSILFVSYLCMVVPNLFLDNYPDKAMHSINPSFIFFSVFIMVNYFKSINLKNEKNLELRTNELKELNEFKSQFFTNISHEIKTPLTLIKGYVDNLKTLPQNPVLEQTHKATNQQINKITEIVNNVLDLAKMDNAEFNIGLSPLNISSLVQKVYANFEALFAKKDIRFLWNNNTDCEVYIDGNSAFMEKALNNLLLNAYKYTDEEGTVRLSISQEDKDLIISVSDTGIGINPTDIERIFDRFYQVNNDINKSGGSGIGLSFSKEIIHLHHGTISVKSIPNQETTFTIHLPLKTENEVADTFSTQKKTGKKSSRSKKIKPTKQTFLIVDDNDDMRSYLISILQNYHCIEARDGKEALAVIESNKTIDFVITDNMMPKMNGYELIKELVANHFDKPIIMLTAKSDTEDKLKVLRLGIDDYITKPFNKEELLVRIQNAMKNNKAKMSFVSTQQLVENDDDLIQQIEEYVLLHSGKFKVTIESIALEFNTSKSSLNRKIKSATGLTPNKFITEVKLQKARRIIEQNPNILLKQLTAELGFNNTTYFSKIYTERFGRKPLGGEG